MTERWGMWVIELRGQDVQEWLQAYDLEANGGLGAVLTTNNPAQALVFSGVADVLTTWKRVSKTRPTRPDGRPNRPLSAFTVSPKKLP